MDVRLVLLRPVQDGAGVHSIGSEYVCDDKEAVRLLRLGAAKKIATPAKVDEKSAEPTGTGEGDEFTEEEYAAVIAELNTIDGVNDALAEKLVAEGFQSIEDVANAAEEALVEIEGIGKKSVKKIMTSAQSLLAQ